ncbi:hypothetical protein [Egbenema bharatensis]|uniref:hypothetical protein n=1 Tax=Egbenema bharatensis TaxID=3463334 RepID=UPI003A866C36
MAKFKRQSRHSQPWTTQQHITLSRSWAFISAADFDRLEAMAPDEWTSEKLIQMSNSRGLFYTGL